jgi:putative DNA primase/helicase
MNMQNTELALVPLEQPVEEPIAEEPISEETALMESHFKVHVDDTLSSNPYLSEDILRMIHGDYEWHPKSKDRRYIDTLIIRALLRAGISRDAITFIFRAYPTTGTYSNHHLKERYLDGSINRAVKDTGKTEEELRNKLFVSGSIYYEKGILKLHPCKFQVYLRNTQTIRRGSETRLLYRYEGKKYFQIDDDSLNELCQEELGEYRYLFKNSDITKVRHHFVDPQAKISETADLDLIGLNNGTFNLMTQTSGPFTPDLFINNILPFDYDPPADCPTFKRFLDEIFLSNSDVIQFVQEIIGYSLHRSMPRHSLFLFLGSGGNGKSVLLDVIAALHGEENVANVRLGKLNDEKYVVTLMGKTVNIASESSFSRNYQTDTLKQVTAGDLVTGRNVFERPVTFKSYAKHYIAVNKMPDFGDNSNGIMRRTFLVIFPRIIQPHEADVSLTDKLMLELPGIFNWALEGLSRLKQNSFMFSYTDDMKKDMRAAYYEGNYTIEFLESYLIKKPKYEDRVSYTEAYRAYKEFMVSERQKPLGKKEFRQIVEGMGYWVGPSTQDKNHMKIRYAKLKNVQQFPTV